MKKSISWWYCTGLDSVVGLEQIRTNSTRRPKDYISVFGKKSMASEVNLVVSVM